MHSQPPVVLIELLSQAITQQLVIQFKFNNRWRTVEPYQVGLAQQKQALMLYGYCRDVAVGEAETSRWQLFRLEQIQEMELTNYGFKPHVDYQSRLSPLHSIICRV